MDKNGTQDSMTVAKINQWYHEILPDSSLSLKRLFEHFKIQLFVEQNSAQRTKEENGGSKGKNKKECCQSTQLAKHFKMSTISWGFVGLIHGQVAKVIDL
jgi:hypothetical protein